MKFFEVPQGQLLAPLTMAFNASLCEFQGKHILAYRREDRNNGNKTDICITQVTGAGLHRPVPGTGRVVQTVSRTPSSTYHEDPRLFVHKDQLWLCYVQARYDLSKGFSACQCLAEIDLEGRVIREHLIKLGTNFNLAAGGTAEKSEKNWVFFSHGDEIRFLYTISPTRCYALNPDTGVTTLVSEAPLSHNWAHGYLSGGTTLVLTPDGSEYFGAFHSYTQAAQRVYHMGFFAISSEAPHLVTRMSKVPVQSASRDDSRDLRPVQNSWRPLVVFPCGIAPTETGYAISGGWNDCRIMVGHYGAEELDKLTITPFQTSPRPRVAPPARTRSGKSLLIVHLSDTWEESQARLAFLSSLESQKLNDVELLLVGAPASIPPETVLAKFGVKFAAIWAIAAPGDVLPGALRFLVDQKVQGKARYQYGIFIPRDFVPISRAWLSGILGRMIERGCPAEGLAGTDFCAFGVQYLVDETSRMVSGEGPLASRAASIFPRSFRESPDVVHLPGNISTLALKTVRKNGAIPSALVGDASAAGLRLVRELLFPGAI